MDQENVPFFYEKRKNVNYYNIFDTPLYDHKFDNVDLHCRNDHINTLTELKHENYVPHLNADPFKQKLSACESALKKTFSPYKVLDAPSLEDDFYLSLLDWSQQNVLGVGLANSIYLWNANSGTVLKLLDLESDKVTSLKFLDKGEKMVVGSVSGETRIVDLDTQKVISQNKFHTARIGTIENYDENSYFSGSRDKNIVHWDLRKKELVLKFCKHRQEVCGLKYNKLNYNLASGGNENKLYIWDIRKNKYIYKLHHTAAIKALAWSPSLSGMLVSGGGTQDKSIKMWNTNDGTLIKSIDTEAQVCNLGFSKDGRNFISTHGYSLNSAIVWDVKTHKQQRSLMGHSSRVIYMSMSPNGEDIVTGAADETLRFWHVFDNQKSKVQYDEFR